MKKHASIYWLTLFSLCLGLAATVLADPPAPVVTSAAPASATPALPYGVQEVVKMYQGGISKDIITRYVENSTLPMHLTADGIIYLQRLGLPQEIMSAILSRDGVLQKEATAAYQQQQQMSAAIAANAQTPGAAAPPVVQPSTPAPAVAPYPYSEPAPAVGLAPDVVYPDYYPYYGYPYYGPVIIGGGWGWGWGHPGWRGGWHGGFAGHGGFGHR